MSDSIPPTPAPTPSPTPPAPDSPMPPSQAPPRLTRSTSDQMLGGVCGGLGHYFNIDPIWFRIGFVVLALGGGSSVLLYIVLWLVMPEDSGDHDTVPRPRPPTSNPPAAIVVGLILIAVGAMILINLIEPSIGRYFWPLALLASGFALVTGGRSRDRH